MKIDIRQTEVSVLQVPRKALTRLVDVPFTLEAILETFSAQSVRPSDVRVENRGATPGDLQYAIALLGASFMVTLKMEGVDAWTNGPFRQLSMPEIAGVCDSLLTRLGSQGTRRRQIAVRFHGVPDVPIDPWLSSHFREDALSSDFKVSGVSFAAVLQPAEITVALERSLLVPDGIFVGVTLSFSGDVAPETAAKDAADSLIKILGRFGIDAAG